MTIPAGCLGLVACRGRLAGSLPGWCRDGARSGQGGRRREREVHGSQAETPLHWAASSDDVEVLDALIDCGAGIEAPGAVIAGGTPLGRRVGVQELAAANRLAERGATTTLVDAAALGPTDRLEGSSRKRRVRR